MDDDVSPEELVTPLSQISHHLIFLRPKTDHEDQSSSPETKRTTNTINWILYRKGSRVTFFYSHLIVMFTQRLSSGLEAISKKINRRWISSSQLTVELTKDTSRFDRRPAKEDLVFGTTMSDHMLMIEWESKNGWGAPKIVPYQNLSLSPAATSLHYGLQCFEGMKAYKSLGDESLRLFRPDKNMERLSNSMYRLHMPGADFDRKEFEKCIAELVKVDKKWIPSGEGYSLYIRPTCIATHPFLGLVSIYF